MRLSVRAQSDGESVETVDPGTGNKRGSLHSVEAESLPTPVEKKFLCSLLCTMVFSSAIVALEDK